MASYQGIPVAELRTMAKERAALRECSFDLERTPDDGWLASFKQQSQLGEVILLSSETFQDEGRAIATLLEADDLERSMGR